MLEWLLARVVLGFFIKLRRGKSWALRHTTHACSGLPKLMLACGEYRVGQSFPPRATRHFGFLGQVRAWRSLRAGGLVACFHPKSPSDKNQSKSAGTLGNNKVCNGSRRQKRRNTPEILPISFPSTLYLLTQTLILKGITSKHVLILLDAGRSVPQHPALTLGRTRAALPSFICR